MIEHDYLSTACFHELHEACRKRCKFCENPCRCPCHTLKLPSGEVQLMVGEDSIYIQAPMPVERER